MITPDPSKNVFTLKYEAVYFLVQITDHLTLPIMLNFARSVFRSGVLFTDD